MSWVERLENLGKMAVGASLAFYLCNYAWKVGPAGSAGMLAGLIFVICFLGRGICATRSPQQLYRGERCPCRIIEWEYSSAEMAALDRLRTLPFHIRILEPRGFFG